MDRLIHDMVAAKKTENSNAGAARSGEDRASSGGRSKGAPTEGSLEEVLEDDDDVEFKEDFV